MTALGVDHPNWLEAKLVLEVNKNLHIWPEEVDVLVMDASTGLS